MIKHLFLFFIFMGGLYSASAMATVSITILPKTNLTLVYSEPDDINNYLKPVIINKTTNYTNMSQYLDGHKTQNKTNLSWYLYGSNLNLTNCNISNSSGYFNCTFNPDRFNATSYNATIPNASYFNSSTGFIIPISGIGGREASECVNAKNKDWEYYKVSLFAMGFDVSGQTQSFIDMIINNMGKNSYYHRCLDGY